ncbi:MAG: TonB-dependent receptor plug domain-containing protein, partial [Shewanella sp.]
MLSAQAVAAQSASIERIAVTGSHIQRQDWESASPMTVIDAATIKAQGFTSIEQVLQQQTSMPGAAYGANTNNGARGVAQVDLRGLGAKRTLVLLNGRRMVNSGSGADSAVDLNAIPLPMVARIEILKDGASAVYGSDAIAGVVNIITEQQYDGLQLDMTGGASTQGDGATQQFSAIYGVNRERANYSVGLVFSDRAEVMQGDRDWYKPTDHNSSAIPSGTLNGMVQDEHGKWVSLSQRYNYAGDVYFQTPNERRSVFASMNHTLDEGLVLNMDAMYTNRRSNQQLSGQPAKINLNVCTPLQTEDCIILDDAMLAAGIGANALGQVQYQRRMSEVGPRIYSQNTDTWRLSAGLAGQLALHRGLDWHIDYSFGKNQADTAVANSIHADWMTEAIYGDQDQWFSGKPLTADMMQAVSFTERTRGGNEQQTLSAQVNGELLALSAGAVEFALGAEYRRESGYFSPDPIMIAGQGTAPRQEPTDGSYEVFSVFQELSIPFSKALQGQVALRLD